MAEQTVEVLVEGGKANAGPPLGSTLGPMGVNVSKIVEEINSKTKSLSGMKVPVKVTVDSDTKDFSIEIGTPPVAALIKKELGLDKGSGKSGHERVGDLSTEQAKSISRAKFGSEDKPFLNQVKGTAMAMGVSVGQGEVTEEEKHRYEEEAQAEQEAQAQAEQAKAKAKEEPTEKAEGAKEEPAEKKG